MIKDILAGTKEVVVELSSGLKENCLSLSTQVNSCLDEMNLKMMGSYEEIEAYEEAKAKALEEKSEKSA